MNRVAADKESPVSNSPARTGKLSPCSEKKDAGRLSMTQAGFQLLDFSGFLQSKTKVQDTGKDGMTITYDTLFVNGPVIFLTLLSIKT
jgi:hypothetical protein